MTAQELSQIRAYIKGAYPYTKDDEQDDLVWFDMLQTYDYAGVLHTVKAHIRSGNKYAPAIAEIIGGYESILDKANSDIIEQMTRAGEFDDQENVKLHDGRVIATDPEVSAWNKQNRIEKAERWLSSGTMPDWFRKIYEKYKKVMTERYFGSKTGRLELRHDDIRT